jgi:hypothetical protein
MLLQIIPGSMDGWVGWFCIGGYWGWIDEWMQMEEGKEVVRGKTITLVYEHIKY